MPWASGVYTRGYPSWSADAASNLPISATKFDTEDNDFAAGLNNCLTKDGLNTPNAPMTWALSNGQILQLNRGSDGAVLGIGRTGGANNPSFKFSIGDSGGLTISASSGTGINMTAAGAITIAAPSAGNALNVNAFAGSVGAQINGSSTSGGSFGLAVLAGTTTADYSIALYNQAGTSNFLKVNGVGNTTLSAASGITLTANQVVGANNPAIQIQGASTAGQSNGLFILAGNGNAADRALDVLTYTGAARLLGIFGDGHFSLGNNGAAAIIAGSAAGNVTLSAPSSGAALAVNGVSNGQTAVFTAGATSGQSLGVVIKAGTTSADYALVLQNQAGTVNQWFFGGDGGAYTAGLSSEGSGTLNAAGFYVGGVALAPGIPQHAISGAYTMVLSDANKHLYQQSAGTVTIPANSSVAFPVGTAVTIVNYSGSAISVACNDSLNWSPSGASGTRTLSNFGEATALKVTTTDWLISGPGLS